MTTLYKPLHTLGIDISDHSVRAAVVRAGSRKSRVVDFADMNIDTGIIQDGQITDASMFGSVMSRLLKDIHGHQRMTAVVGLPEYHGFIKTIIASEENQATEIQNHLPFPYDEVTIDTVRKEQLMSFAAVKTNIAQSYIDALVPVGVHIRALEIESQALARMFASSNEQFLSENQAIVLADIGRSNTTFVVVRNGFIEFTHTSKLISGGMLSQLIQQQFGVSPDEAERIKIEQQDHPSMQALIQAHTTALTNELRRVVSFHQSHPVTEATQEYQVYLIGGGSQIQNLRHYLEATIQQPVQQAKMPAHVVLPRKLRSRILSFGTAIGLALRDFQPL